MSSKKKKSKKSFHGNIKSVSFVDIVLITLLTLFLLFCFHTVFYFYTKKYDIVVYTYPEVFIIIFGIFAYITVVIKNRDDKDLYPRGIKSRMITAIIMVIVIIALIFTSGIFITESNIIKRICFVQHSYSYSEIKEAERNDAYEGFVSFYNSVEAPNLEYRIMFNDGKNIVVSFGRSKYKDDSSYMKFDQRFFDKRTIIASRYRIQSVKGLPLSYKEYLLNSL